MKLATEDYTKEVIVQEIVRLVNLVDELETRIDRLESQVSSLEEGAVSE